MSIAKSFLRERVRALAGLWQMDEGISSRELRWKPSPEKVWLGWDYNSGSPISVPYVPQSSPAMRLAGPADRCHYSPQIPTAVAPGFVAFCLPPGAQERGNHPELIPFASKMVQKERILLSILESEQNIFLASSRIEAWGEKLAWVTRKWKLHVCTPETVGVKSVLVIQIFIIIVAIVKPQLTREHPPYWNFGPLEKSPNRGECDFSGHGMKVESLQSSLRDQLTLTFFLSSMMALPCDLGWVI